MAARKPLVVEIRSSSPVSSAVRCYRSPGTLPPSDRVNYYIEKLKIRAPADGGYRDDSLYKEFRRLVGWQIKMEMFKACGYVSVIGFPFAYFYLDACYRKGQARRAGNN